MREGGEEEGGRERGEGRGREGGEEVTYRSHINCCRISVQHADLKI